MNKNIGKFIRVMILATWAILFGQLLNRDYFVKTLDIRESQAIQRGREESFLGIYFKQERIGYVKNRVVEKNTGGVILYQDAVLYLNIMETNYPIKMHLQADLTNSSLLEHFRFSLFSPFYSKLEKVLLLNHSSFVRSLFRHYKYRWYLYGQRKTWRHLRHLWHK